MLISLIACCGRSRHVMGFISGQLCSIHIKATKTDTVFTCPPKSSPPPRCLFVSADMGQHTIDGSLDWAGEPGSVNSTRKMGQEALDNPGHYAGVLHIGDISYARGHASEWDMYFDQVQTLSSHIPYQICLGNHERDYPDSGSYWQGTDSGGECGVPTERYFITPRKSEGQPWYSLNMGSVHVLFMSTEHNFTVGSDQWKFLQGDLASVDRTVTPWVIFAGHRPMYVTTLLPSEAHDAETKQYD